ncbi:class I SAM-dependent methyltransferase [Streptomyces durmitorensis]|uniref:Class I SAM-dependent methyltransferase n=1 Tax=Streptomyces durmitorensis TaxID=319947 RepID=A0ABY4PLX6_9ACTN|nr:class I SAM-dependent methyltransferase [Streptomyces durmitorensis]UQT53859.1 class I SAM-dependent methyltransferase [Streptomyces durmitorensis]
MHRQQISSIAHSGHPIAAPLSDDSVHALLDRALPHGEARLLDLGCGSGTWPARAQAMRPSLRADGVDIDAGAIAAARRAADEAGLGDRVAFHTQDAAEFTSPHLYDVVVSVGATHAFGGLLPTLKAAGRHLSPGGSVLVGDGFWEREPDRATLDAGFTADEYVDLATTVDHVMAEGWTPVYGHVSTLQEWDAYEWSWTGDLSRWALDHPEHPDTGQALEAAAAHRDAWLHGYRGTLGFVTLLLRRTPTP